MAFTFNGAVPSTIVLGNDATTQNLFTLTNKVGSRVNVLVRNATVRLDTIAALATVMSVVKCSRATAISGGAILTPSAYSTTQTSSASVEVRTAVMDGFPITATQGDTVYQSYCGRMHTVVEQVQQRDTKVLPELIKTQDFVIRPNESVLFQVVGAAVTSNARLANYWFVQCEWEEDPIATFAISGTVTLSAAPVAGAIVTVIEADDESMTNPVLVEKIVTGAGGTWASTIKTGKVGAAFVQYKSGATYYTAPGSPYLA
jgi:hypothetical protein